MSTVFSRIIAGEIPSYRVGEDERYYAFLDINPVRLGHTLVVPKLEVDYLFDLDVEVLSGILPFAGRVARALESVLECKRVGLAVLGLEVPHAHVHLIPINSEGDLDFAKRLTPAPTAEDMAELGQRILRAFEAGAAK